MTTTLIAPGRTPAAIDWGCTRAVLTISGMPKHLRLRVEELMVEHLSPPPAEYGIAEIADVWDTTWFTRWHKEPGRGATVSCREVLYAPAFEVAAFRATLAELAETFRFSVALNGR